MNWLKGMNSVIEYIEENLTRPIKYESLSRIVGCSVYEFSRIFSFMAGVSISEYIRRRRLSQVVFDIQKGEEKIIDIAFKYCYESPTTFTRAFKELHGTTPTLARNTNIPLKTFPLITFVLTIKGMDEMIFRIEKQESFQIMGLAGYIPCEQKSGEKSLWDRFIDDYNPKLWKHNSYNFYTAPFYQVGAYSFESENGKTKTIIGAEYKGEMPEGLTLQTIPAATWAVFSIKGITGATEDYTAYSRIITEWFPTSQYKRNETVPHLEVYPGGEVNADYIWEIWMPILSKQ